MWKGSWPQRRASGCAGNNSHRMAQPTTRAPRGKLEMLRVPHLMLSCWLCSLYLGIRKLRVGATLRAFSEDSGEGSVDTNTSLLGTLGESAWPWVHHGTSGPIPHLWKENQAWFPRLLLILKVSGSMFYFKLPCSSRSSVSYLYEFI